MSGQPVKYGLQIRKKKGAGGKKKTPLNIFASDQDDTDGGQGEALTGRAAVNARLMRMAENAEANSDVQDQHAKALAEDASVFDYDGAYDDFKQETSGPAMRFGVGANANIRGSAKEGRQQSKYIHIFKAKALEREREHEILHERKLARERAQDDHLYGDKEKFVTSSYKRKLQEQKEYLEREAKKLKEEEANDVTKKKGGLSNFYSNLMTKNVSMGGGGDTGASSNPNGDAHRAAGTGEGGGLPDEEREREKRRQERAALIASHQQQQQQQQREGDHSRSSGQGNSRDRERSRSRDRERDRRERRERSRSREREGRGDRSRDRRYDRGYRGRDRSRSRSPSRDRYRRRSRSGSAHRGEHNSSSRVPPDTAPTTTTTTANTSSTTTTTPAAAAPAATSRAAGLVSTAQVQASTNKVDKAAEARARYLARKAGNSKRE